MAQGPHVGRWTQRRATRGSRAATPGDETIPGVVDIVETPLPGHGVRYDLVTRGGDRVGVVARHDGRRELVLFDADDPDAAGRQIMLEDDELRALGEMLGAAHIVERRDAALAAGDLGASLSLAWVHAAEGSALVGVRVGALRERVPASVGLTALLRTGRLLPGPPDELVLEAGDHLVLAGPVSGLDAAAEALTLR